jgi:hypothetical protein
MELSDVVDIDVLYRLRNTTFAISPWPFAIVGTIALLLLPVGTPMNVPESDGALSFLILSQAAFLCGMGMIWKGLNDLMILRFIRDTPTSSIGSMASGDTEIKGAARKLETEFDSPFSDRRCVAFEYKIEEYRSAGRSRKWETVDFGGTNEPFALEDDTGAAAVDPSKASLRIDWDVAAKTDGDTEPPEAVRDFIMNSEELSFEYNKSMGTGNPRRYKEKVVSPGQELYVFGEGSSYSKHGIKEVHAGKAPIYLISDKPEDALSNDFSTWYKRFIPAGLLAGIIGYGGLYASLL